MSMTATEPASTADVLTEALRLAALGWRVLPIRPGEKRPPMSSWQHAASADAATIRAWWTGLYRGHGLGVATGRVGDGWLFVLDVDEKPGISGAETLADLEAAHGPLPATVEAQTGSGGRHIYLRAPVEVRNDAGRRLGPGLDIRGEGGQVLAPPTLHPNGRPYAWLIGQEPGEHEVADAPAWLVAMLVDEQQGAPTPAERVPGAADDGPAARYNASTTWAELLERDGWTLHHTARDGEQHWVRPGKERREGTSATVGYRGADMLRVFTSSVAWLPEGAYSRFGYAACRDFGGDRSTAARALLEAEQAELAPWRAQLEAQASKPAEASPEDAAGDWDRVDLVSIGREIAAGTRRREVPELLHVEGATPLLYRGRINMLFGESGGGKTWTGLAAIVERVQAGERCLLIDYEDTPDGTVSRLLALGLEPGQLAMVDYRHPSTSLLLGLGDGLDEMTEEYGLVVLDSTGEGMAASGTNPDKDDEVARWFVLLKRLLRLPGSPAILILDHVPKASDAPSLYAIGSQRKRAAVTGASYRVDTIKSPARGRDGLLRLTVGKDRLGTRPQGSVACEVTIVSDGETGAVAITFCLSESQAAEGKPFRPTVLMERVSRWLELNPRATRNAITDGVQGKQAHKVTAISMLVEEGWVRVDEGARGSRCHTVVTPYREAEDVLGVGPRPTATPPRPHRDPGRGADRDPATPPPIGGVAVEQGLGRGETGTTATPARPAFNLLIDWTGEDDIDPEGA